VGVVTGDDLLPRLDELLGAGHELRNMDTGESLDSVRDRVLSANAYIGSTRSSRRWRGARMWSSPAGRPIRR
jgi:hypothetical protein